MYYFGLTAFALISLCCVLCMGLALHGLLMTVSIVLGVPLEDNEGFSPVELENTLAECWPDDVGQIVHHRAEYFL
jgi:hypothetical protein